MTFSGLLLLLSLACLCQGKNLTLVLLKDAAQEGAVCLDGSATGFYIREGSGSGVNKWILHLGGGGWCLNETDCYHRSMTWLGSSKSWPSSVAIGGLLSDNSTVNPDFYNWNIVYLMYCDGASFAGSVADPINVNGKAIYFRGQQILKGDLDALLASGMNSASEVVLTGCSAGGLATYLHVDTVAAYLPQSIKIRAMADAGYFLDIKTVHGEFLFQKAVQYVYMMQNVSGGVNQACLEAHLGNEEWRCFFAPYAYPYIKTPIFVLNSQYDTAQLSGILQLGCLPPNCSQEQMEFFNNFRVEFLAQATPALLSTSNGIFIDSCLVHCQTLTDDTWSVYKVSGQLMSETFADWYFGRSGKTQVVDCAYPCNPTCPGVHPLDRQLPLGVALREKLGQQVLKGDLDALLARGMSRASEVLLAGWSAGGLPTFLHVDAVAAYLPQNIKVQGMADAGYFLDIKNVYGKLLYQEKLQYVYTMQNVSGGVNQACLEAHLDNEEWRCFFAPYAYPYIKTPIFVINSLYDTYQLGYILQLGCLPPNCSSEQMEIFNNFRVEFLAQATPALVSTSNGFFLDSCLIHGQTYKDETWSKYKVSGQLISETFANWYFGRSGKTKVVDCAYPCNPTCPGIHLLDKELAYTSPPWLAAREKLF